MQTEQMKNWVDSSLQGDQQALEKLLISVQDLVYNLSLRMLGNPTEAQDASQDIMVKLLTRLSTFRRESSFTTWVYRLAINTLLDYRKKQSDRPELTFEFFGADISRVQEESNTFEEAEKAELAEELKRACTNMMLQCLDNRSRAIFILGTMFRIDSRTGGEILDMTPDSYRQRLSRSRKKMSEFLKQYCEMGGGMCRCSRRIEYAYKQGRIVPGKPEYLKLQSLPEQQIEETKEAMEEIDLASEMYGKMAKYASSTDSREFLMKLLTSEQFRSVGAITRK